MKKILVLLMALQVLSFNVSAQTNGSLKGKVTDSTGKAIEAATIEIYKKGDAKLQKMATTTKEGTFEVGLAEGIYELSVSAVGYHTFKSKDINVKGNGEVNNAGTFGLKQSADNLKDVTITAKKPMVEVKPDKMVVNVDAYISNAGSNALEVLEKSPGVTVDRDGNISLKGKTGVIILVDGKQTYLSGADLANLLRNTPSNQLETIEIMTQPSAKYDASGNSGIINIRTKKGRQNGFNGTVNLGFIQGVYPKSPNSITLNYKKNKINWFGNASFSYWEGFSDLNLVRKFTDQNGQELTSVFDQESNNRFIGRNTTIRTGLDYSIDKMTTIGFQVFGTYNPRTFSANSTAHIYNGKGILDSTNVAFSQNKDPWKNGGVNLNLRKRFDTSGRELSVDLDYIVYRSRSKQTSDNHTYYPDGSTPGTLFINGYLPSNINIYSVKVDYVHPLGKAGKIEAGIKSSLVKTDNDAQYTLWDEGQKAWVNDTGRTNHFLYDENINAVYASYNREIGKWSIQAGLRLEHTYATGDQITKDSSFTRNYAQLFPTAYLSYKLNTKNTFTMSYGRRIERPNYQDMNPFQYFLDQFTYRQGNPMLQPQFSNNIELSHNFKGVLNTTLNFTQTTDVINDVLKQNQETKVTYLTKENVAKRRNIGLAISYNQPLTKWWTVSLYGNVFNNFFEGVINNEPLKADITSFTGNMNNQFKITKTWSAELSGFYRSRMLDAAMMVAEPMGVVSCGFSKQILKTKGTVKVNIVDPFYIQKFRGTTQHGPIDVNVKAQWDNRRVGFTFVYRFGTQQQGAAPRRRSGSATDEQNRVGGSGQQ